MRIECPHCEARVRLDEPPEDDTPIRCPECRKKFVPPETDDEDDRRPARKGGKKGGKRRAAEEPKSMVPWIAAGGVVAVAAVIGIVVVVMSSGSKPDPKPAADTAANTTPPPAPQPAPRPAPRPAPNQTPPRTPTTAGVDPDVAGDKPPGTQGVVVPPTGGPTRPVAVPQAAIPAQYADLFRQAADRPPRTIRAASLRPKDADLVPEVPTFHSLLMARKTAPASTVAPKAAKLTLDELKKACAYIKVDAGDMSGTGSGFLIAQDGPAGLVATNYHVIEAAARPRFSSGTASVTAVFNSGQADERVTKAQIVAFDPLADLAILRVEGGGGTWPKAINPYNALPKLVEGTEIQFWGFPLGEILASGRRNPEITLGKGSVSSLRYTAGGKLDRVQISGTMNPGNSGGPLVDADGRLVGVAVSIINPKLGAGIGFAVPVNDLIALLEGRILDTIFVPTELDNASGRAKFLVVAPVMDPLDRVDTVFIRRWSGAGKAPEAVKDAQTGYKPFGIRKDGKANLPGVDEFPLKKFNTRGSAADGLGIALGEMEVPLDAAEVQIQLASQTFPNLQTGTKLTAASKPVAYTLKVGDQPVGSDARAFSDLTANPDALAGQVLVVKARVAAPPATRDPVQDLIIVGSDGKRPDRMRFLVDRAAAAEFDEVVPEHQIMPVRLVCVVGKRGADGVVPVRVARLDFLGRADRVVRTIPAAPDPEDKLAELNRDPAKFAGQSLELKVSSVPLTQRVLQTGEYMVVFPSRFAPRNLMFTINPGMRQRLMEAVGQGLRPGMIVPTRITAVVPARPDVNGRTTITVTKIEITDEEGRVARTIE